MVGHRLRLVSVLGVITAVVLAGYLIFWSTVQGIVTATSPLTLLMFAVVAGVATFFNPCSFPLLPIYLTHYSSVNGEKRVERAESLYNGIVAGIGVALFSLVLGAIIGGLGEAFGRSLALSGGEPNPWVLAFRGAVGALLIVLGLSHFLGKGIGFHILSPLGQRLTATQGAGRTVALFVYGFGYNAIGIGCGGPIMAGLSIFAFSSGGFSAAFSAFIAYAVTMAALMVLVSLLAGPMKSMRISAVLVQRISAMVQAAVGILIILSVIYVEAFVGLLFPA